MNYCYQTQNCYQTSSTHKPQNAPEDADNYNFLPFQDHIKPISRPSHIHILKTQLLQPHVTNNKHNKDTPTVQKAKPSHIPVFKDKKYHLYPPNILQTPSSLTAPSKQSTKNTVNPTYAEDNYPVTTHPSRLEENLFYQCHLH